MDFGRFVQHVGIVWKGFLEFVEDDGGFGGTVLRKAALHQREAGEAPQRGFGVAIELLLEIGSGGVAGPVVVCPKSEHAQARRPTLLLMHSGRKSGQTAPGVRPVASRSPIPVR